ncbi:unnamed protein product [Thelazia callipaeda]|uniref:PHD-type domain-containing protein n=1 Tax=Thelazia callipaeda TaxID=103827 RepID=A0A0N5CUR4_THECL|nr:unnamed protein product [Thelazia callipaeda]
MEQEDQSVKQPEKVNVIFEDLTDEEEGHASQQTKVISNSSAVKSEENKYGNTKKKKVEAIRMFTILDILTAEGEFDGFGSAERMCSNVSESAVEHENRNVKEHSPKPIKERKGLAKQKQYVKEMNSKGTNTVAEVAAVVPEAKEDTVKERNTEIKQTKKKEFQKEIHHILLDAVVKVGIPMVPGTTEVETAQKIAESLIEATEAIMKLYGDVYGEISPKPITDETAHTSLVPSSEPNILQTEVVDHEPRRYCICQSTDDSSFMICCDFCEVWYHGDCVKVDAVLAKRMEKYACPYCNEKDENQKTVYRITKRGRKKRTANAMTVDMQKEGSSSMPIVSGEMGQEEKRDGRECHNCINFSSHCGSCNHCQNSVEPCLKRICLISDCCNKGERNRRKMKNGAKCIAKNTSVLDSESVVYSFSSRGRRRRMKYVNMTEYEDSDNGNEDDSEEKDSLWKHTAFSVPDTKKRRKRMGSRRNKRKNQKNGGSLQNNGGSLQKNIATKGVDSGLSVTSTQREEPSCRLPKEREISNNSSSMENIRFLLKRAAEQNQKYMEGLQVLARSHREIQRWIEEVNSASGALACLAKLVIENTEHYFIRSAGQYDFNSS